MKSGVKRVGLTLCLGTLMMVSFSGCAVFSNFKDGQLPTEDVSSGDSAVGQPAQYYVEMHPSFAKPKLFKGTITEPITVQRALEESGAMAEMKAMTVDLYRRLPDGRSLKLPVDFKKNKQVKYEQDYSLHPNDRLVVRAKSSSALDKLVDQVFGDL